MQIAFGHTSEIPMYESTGDLYCAFRAVLAAGTNSLIMVMSETWLSCAMHKMEWDI